MHKKTISSDFISLVSDQGLIINKEENIMFMFILILRYGRSGYSTDQNKPFVSLPPYGENKYFHCKCFTPIQSLLKT